MDKQKALNKAMALCSRTECSEQDIRMKLKLWELTASDIESILDQLRKEKFLDDLRYATAYARDKVRLNHWGRMKIRYMLSAERVNPAFIDEALHEIEPTLYEEVLKDILVKKSRELSRESDPRIRKQKLIRFAAGRGFETEIILRLLQEM